MNKRTLMIYTDGGARGNPGPAAIGVFVRDQEGKTLAKFGKKIGRTTNNVAEYQAVIEAQKWLTKNKKDLEVLSKVNFFLDSNLVVNQLTGLFKVKEPHLRELILKIRILEREVGAEIYYQYIPREKNKIADSLVNEALDTSTN